MHLTHADPGAFTLCYCMKALDFAVLMSVLCYHCTLFLWQFLNAECALRIFLYEKSIVRSYHVILSAKLSLETKDLNYIEKKVAYTLSKVRITDKLDLTSSALTSWSLEGRFQGLYWKGIVVNTKIYVFETSTFYR